MKNDQSRPGRPKSSEFTVPTYILECKFVTFLVIYIIKKILNAINARKYLTVK